MTNRVVTFFGIVALCGQCFISASCSSSGTTPGAATGGSTGTGGSNVGAGGSTGALACDKGGAGPTLVTAVGDPCVGIKNKAPCDMDGMPGTADDKACWNTCGPAKTGVKNCVCTGGAWACPTCDFDITDPHKFDCYNTATSQACPSDPTDPTGMMLPISGGACTLASCKPCGSASATSYRDSSNAAKAGWCICVPNADGSAGGLYSCASVAEWAPVCH